MSTMPRPASVSPKAPSDRGPVGFVLVAALTAVFTVFFSWLFSIAVEIGGMHSLWPDRGVLHSRDLVIEDLGYIAAAPHSLLVDDTVAFAHELLQLVAIPFDRLDVVGFYDRTFAETAPSMARATTAGPAKSAQGFKVAGNAFTKVSRNSKRMFATIGVVAFFTAQDAALRLAIVVFALPAFVLACLLGAVDGLGRRDLRKWNGGRESSLIYHHAKSTTAKSLAGGFALYLAWPFGGFNPSYMVLACTALVAASLSLTVSSFKKYL